VSGSALLLLEDGAAYHGTGLGPPGVAEGEAVFFTGMTGYEEALTDPSYNGQLLVFCYPLIGNYGVDPAVRQHRRIVASGIVSKRVSRHPSHWRSTGSVPDWLDDAGVRGIEGIDTRALVTRLREEGTMRAVLAVGDAAVAAAPAAIAAYLRKPLATPDLVDAVSAKGDPTRGSGPVRIALLDCGVKDNIANYLAAEGAVVLEVPFDTTFDEILALNVDGLLVSNGPGDPSELGAVVETLRRAVAHRTLPTFGICLGHQLLALALGGTTFKMKYGHRGGNQPVQDVRTGSVIITAQNHGYAVDAASLPPDVEQTMINLNDGTNEGLRHRTLPVESVQFHPEASPGPGDARGFFKRFVDVMRRG
jgi:carbamoyl-phosphate synthase small subunit